MSELDSSGRLVLSQRREEGIVSSSVRESSMLVCDFCAKSRVAFTLEIPKDGRMTYRHADGTKCNGYLSYRFKQLHEEDEASLKSVNLC